MFSLIAAAFGLYIAIFAIKKSKPNKVFLNPVETKNYIVDRYIEIQAMPDGVEKQQAHKLWQESCHQIKKLQK